MKAPTLLRLAVGLLLVAVVAELGAHFLHQSHASTTTITGASQAVCNPSPCKPGTYTTITLPNVSDDAGGTYTRTYTVYRPAGLTSSPTNKAPFILVFNLTGTCGQLNYPRLNALADVNRFVVVDLQMPNNRPVPSGTSQCAWQKKWQNQASGSEVPNDEPYITAVVNSILQCPASGAAANQCADPLRLYNVGESGGGGMTADVMCDPTNSTYFRGYWIDSSSLQLYNGVPNCPSTNKNYFAMITLSNFSIDAGFYFDGSLNPHLDISYSSNAQLHFYTWAANHLGCTSSVVKDNLGGTPTGNNAQAQRFRIMAPCSFASSGTAIEAVGVLNGGHTWDCQDSVTNYNGNTNGFGAPQPTGGCSGLDQPLSAATCGTSPNCYGWGSSYPGFCNGYPCTDGLFIEQEFWNMMAQGTSGGSSPPPVIGDFNGDGHVNIFDLSIFLSHWQQTGAGIPEDLNGDGVVNIFDLSMLLSHYGS